jgi:nucleoside-diphosphate-sugar epimerase
MTRYLVTGCAGFIGSHLTDALVQRGHEVIGVDAFTDYYPRPQKESNLEKARGAAGHSLVEVDLSEAALEPLLENVDGIFHLAAQPGVRGSWGATFAHYVRDNILATQRLFEAAASKGVRIVMSSTSSVYGNAETYPTREEAIPRPVSPYGVTKLACESLARAYTESFALEVVLLRYFTVYGPRQRPDMAFARIISALLNGNPFSVYGTGEQSRDFTFVDDAVEATIAAMERGPRAIVYNVGGGSETTLNGAIALCETLAETRLDVVNEPVARGDVRRTGADTTLIRSQLGWRPKTSLAEGLAAQVAAARAASGTPA